MVFILFMLAMDLGVFHKKDHVIKIKEAAIWTAIWILLAMLFGPLLLFKAEWQYLAGYFLEESLSIDNIFVMIMIFASFGIDKKYYHRVLFWGILGAIIMRFLFIFLLGALVSRFSWVLAIFGVILIYSGIKMFFNKMDEKIDTANHPMVKLASRFLRSPSDASSSRTSVRSENTIFAL